MNYSIRKVKSNIWYLEWENGKKSMHSTKKGAEITGLFFSGVTK